MFRRIRKYFGTVGFNLICRCSSTPFPLILILVLVVIFLFLLRVRHHAISSVRGVHKLIPFRSVVFDPYIRLQQLIPSLPHHTDPPHPLFPRTPPTSNLHHHASPHPYWPASHTSPAPHLTPPTVSSLAPAPCSSTQREVTAQEKITGCLSSWWWWWRTGVGHRAGV